jgi:hypothetical protein
MVFGVLLTSLRGARDAKRLFLQSSLALKLGGTFYLINTMDK